MTAIVILAKAPRPGAVKTRLSPPLTLAAAADLAAASIADTLDVVDQIDWTARVLAIDVPDANWTRPGWFQVVQVGRGLDVRIGNALEHARWFASGRPVLLIGMDTPHVTVADLRWARDLLDTHDAVIGPASDGGFWALGLRVADGRLIKGVPMSTAATGSEQLRRLREAGLSVGLATRYRDIDTIDDARAAASRSGRLRFAEVLYRSDAL